MKRTILFIAILMSVMAVKAQLPSFGAMYGAQPSPGHANQGSDTNALQKKWFVTRYAGLSTGFVVFKGGGGSFLSVPLALQVNRQLTNNLYAFGNVSIVPTLFSSNMAFPQPGATKGNSFMQTQTRQFGIYPTARVGLTYVNNEGTFSISGSIGVSRTTYSGYAPFYAPATFPASGPFNNHY